MKGIITGDWHLRHTPPKVSNDDDWFEVQSEMVNKIVNLCIERKCDLYNTGDLYNLISDTTQDLVYLVQESAIKLMRHDLKFYLLAGNHDLQYHSSENLKRCAIGVTLNSLNVYHMNSSPEVRCGNFDEETPEGEIIAKHVLCFPDVDSLPPHVNAKTAPEILNDYKKSKWIFLGDYHHSFHYTKNGRHVINPGCTTIQVADMLDYETGCFFVDTDEEIVEWIPLKIEQKFYDKVELKSDMDLEAFAEGINLKHVTFDFDTNLNNALSNQPENIQNKIKEWQSA